MTSGEYFRRKLRQAVPTAIFRTAALSADWLAMVKTLPWSQARWLMAALSSDDGAASAELKTLDATTLKHPFRLRSRYSDARSFIGTCIRSEYAPAFPRTAPDFVVDAGAYIGDFSALLLTRYPSARLIALEPQVDAFQLARQNLAPYPTAVALHAALWSSQGTLACQGTGIGASVAEGAGANAVPCVSMDGVLSKAEFPRLDLFKCDIEGAEVHVFSSRDRAWLLRTECVLIELHNTEAARTVHAACADAGLRFAGQYRSTHVFRRSTK